MAAIVYSHQKVGTSKRQCPFPDLQYVQAGLKIIAGECIILVIAFFVILVLPGACNAEEKVVTLTSSPWPPYYTKEFPTKGIVPEIITAAYARHGEYSVVFEFRPWARAILEVEKGNVDGAAAAYFSKERARKYLYSAPYMVSPIVFYKRNDLPLDTWKTLDDLKPYVIGVERAFVYSPEFDNADFLRKEKVSSDLFNLKKLLIGRIDLMVIDQFVAEYYINKYLNEQRDKFVKMYPPLQENRLHIMFSRNVPGSEKKALAFNEGLNAIRKDGTLRRILERYGMK